MRAHTVFEKSQTSIIAPAVERRGGFVSRAGFLAVSDTVIVLGVFVTAALLSGEAVLPTLASLAVTIGLACGWLLSLRFSSSRDERILGAGGAEYRRVVVSTLSFAGSAAFLLALFGLDLATGHFVLALPLGIALLLLSRAVWRARLLRERRRGVALTPVLVAGENTLHVARHLSDSPAVGLRPIELMPGRIDHDELVRGAVASRARAVVFAGDLGEPRDAQHMIWSLQDRGIDVIVSTDLIDVAPSRLAYRSGGDMPLAHLRGRTVRSVGHVMKVGVDRICAALGLLLLAPLLGAVALLIRLEDGGPVFFRQNRVCRDGQQFRMVKFRTMCVDAESRLETLRGESDASGPLFKLHDDPRVTRVGRVLRKYSIDELPQLWNVLAGEMSLIGPRPALPHEVADYPAHATRRLLVKPGMTGLWQVSGRSDLPWEAGLRLDLSYVDNWAAHLDLSILARTVGAVIRPRGAY